MPLDTLSAKAIDTRVDSFVASRHSSRPSCLGGYSILAFYRLNAAHGRYTSRHV